MASIWSRLAYHVTKKMRAMLFFLLPPVLLVLYRIRHAMVA